MWRHEDRHFPSSTTQLQQKLKAKAQGKTKNQASRLPPPPAAVISCRPLDDNIVRWRLYYYWYPCHRPSATCAGASFRSLMVARVCQVSEIRNHARLFWLNSSSFTSPSMSSPASSPSTSKCIIDSIMYLFHLSFPLAHIYYQSCTMPTLTIR